jgi:hypothetical protein
MDNRNVMHFSNEILVNIAVPQGGTIAPLLFILFINDLQTTIATGKMTVFADDTTQHVVRRESKTNEDTEQFISLCNRAVSEMSQYSRSNDLLINNDKTLYMQFRRPLKNIISSPLIILNKTVIHEVDEIKFLGLILRNNLNWRGHVNKLAPQIASACYLIKRIMQIGTLKMALLVYFSYIQSRLQYAIILWGHSRETKRLFILQKRALRYMARASANPTAEFYIKDSCKPLFKRFKIMTIPCLYIYNTILYKINNFTSDDIDLNVRTRANGNFKFKIIKLDIARTNPKYAGAKLYNALPKWIKEKKGSNFKNSIKEFLIENSFYSVKEFCVL